MTAGLSGFIELGERYGLQATLRPSSTLYVGFDDISKVRARQRIREGWGYAPARKYHWAYLGVQAFAENWYRDTALISRLERLRDTGFFGGYERVVFSGVSMGAFAACAFADLAPGCILIAYSPQSSLNPEIVPWDRRYPQGSRQDWTLPYSDAAGGIAQARRVWVISDPYFEMDRLHARRIAGANVTHLPARHTNHFAMSSLRRAGILSAVTEGCVDLTMSPARFAQLYRQMRESRSYLEQLAKRVVAQSSEERKQQLHRIFQHRKRPWLAKMVASSLALPQSRST